MAVKQLTICDVCARIKGEANHWLQAWESGHSLAIGHWVAKEANLVRTIHLCGMTCYQKLLSEHLEKTKPVMG